MSAYKERDMTSSNEANATKVVEHQPLTPKLAWQLAAPHTWPASIMPIAVATAAAYAATGVVSFSMSVTLLVICVLMQSAVNTFNDYFDYVKGTDSAADNVEVSDAVLVYNNINPKSAKHLAIGMLVVAFALGIYPIYVAGWIPLAFGLVGALIVVLYSGGKTPISYLPIGEAVSGVVMGGLIPIAAYHVLSGMLDPLMILWSVPTIIGIGLIMLTNNTCDIEKDVTATRKTLPVILGRAKSVKLYHTLVITWIIAIAVIVGIWFRGGLIIVPFMVFAIYPLVKALFGNPIIPQSRVGAMAQICSLNIALGAFYVAGIMACNVCLAL